MLKSANFGSEPACAAEELTAPRDQQLWDRAAGSVPLALTFSPPRYTSVSLWKKWVFSNHFWKKIA